LHWRKKGRPLPPCNPRFNKYLKKKNQRKKGKRVKNLSGVFDSTISDPERVNGPVQIESMLRLP